MSIEETFAKVIGRHASEEERQRLYRLRDALGLRDHDAFWSIVTALQYYDSFFRQYPAQLAVQTERCIEDARAAFAAGGARSRPRAADTLGEGHGDERRPRAPPGRQARGDSPGDDALGRGSGVRSAVVSAGYSLAARVKPFWVAKGETVAPLQKAAGVMLAAPAGWDGVRAPGTGRCIRRESRLGAASESVERRDKVVGWGVVVGCFFAADEVTRSASI